MYEKSEGMPQCSGSVNLDLIFTAYEYVKDSKKDATHKVRKTFKVTARSSQHFSIYPKLKIFYPSIFSHVTGSNLKALFPRNLKEIEVKH